MQFIIRLCYFCHCSLALSCYCWYFFIRHRYAVLSLLFRLLTNVYYFVLRRRRQLASYKIEVLFAALRTWIVVLLMCVLTVSNADAASIASVEDIDFESGASGVDECCRRHNVPEACVKTLCYPSRPPNDFDIYDVFERKTNCSKHLKQVAYCLAAGRDHYECCSNEAKDVDEHTCLRMCHGEGRHEHHDQWSRYQTCLAINIRSMFSCFERGYATAPTPPRRLSVDQVNAYDAQLSWSAPAVNAHLVALYHVYVYPVEDSSDAAKSNNADGSGELRHHHRHHHHNHHRPHSSSSSGLMMNNNEDSNELFFESKSTSVSLTGLDAGTHYRAYVIALSSTEDRRSLRSAYIDFQTSGVAPQVEAFKPLVTISRSATSALLACRFRISGVSSLAKLDLSWQRRADSNDADSFELLNGFRFNHSFYVYSSSKPREHVTTLEIYDIASKDFGVYRCMVADNFGRHTAELELRANEVQQPPSATPPVTPLSCCEARNVDERCLPMCGGASETDKAATPRRYVPRPFMPSNCSGEISKVLSCAMPEIDDSACCLRERIPRQCMYLCDSSIEPSNQMSSICLEHVNSVEQCRIAGVEKRPSAVHGLRIKKSADASIATVERDAVANAFVQWEPSIGAEIYYVYWRRRRSNEADDLVEWERKSQTTIGYEVSSANEVVVVAANSYGISQASKLIFDADSANWTRVA